MMIEVSKIPSKFKYGIFIRSEKGRATYMSVKKFTAKYCLAIFLDDTKARINEKYTAVKKMESVIFLDRSSSKTIKLLLEMTAVKKDVMPNK